MSDTEIDHVEGYQPKMKELLEQVRTEAHERGYDCNEPGDMSDDHYRWFVLVCPKGGEYENGVDVTVSAPESETFDGHEGGVNFSSDVVHYGGVILGGMCPYNYTEGCWVDRKDPEAIRERWELFFAHFDAGQVLDLIDAYYQKEGMASKS